jgi:tetraacyldisaccharide 4'-kinase
MSVFKILLWPFAVLYDAVTTLRNRLYDLKFKASASFDIPIISVGNLVVGGSGKTPMVEHLIRILQSNYKLATLSRGYGRKTKGFRITNSADTAATVGDEPFQIYKKFSDTVHVAVGEDRALAIPMILQELPETQVIIMDDAYQHRRVVPGFSVLLTTYERPFYEDTLLPMGRLREGPEGANRADMIVVTKCPSHMSEDEMMRMENNIRKFTTNPVFFTKIRYADPVAFGDTTKPFSNRVILVTGIANSHVLASHVQHTYALVKHFDFRDHYDFTAHDMLTLKEFVNQGTEPLSILTTEKDSVKLLRTELAPMVRQLPIFYLPIETEFIRNGKDFDTLVLTFLNDFTHS